MKELTVLAAALLTASTIFAHPHFQKKTSAKLPGDVEVNISYFTVPSNETHAQNAATGDFVAPGFAKLEISAPLKAGSVSVPAGTYTVGAIKNGADDWTMALSPGALGFNDKPEMAKLIKLESLFTKSPAKAPHLLVDVTPGHGKFEGKAVLTLGFGSLFLDGLLSDASAQ